MPSPHLLDIEALLVPIPGDNAAGGSLRYEGTYDMIQEARRADDDLPQGAWQHARKVVDWAGVIQLTSEALTTKSKDLHIAVWLVEALVNQHGFPGLRDGLRLLKELQERYWGPLYPESEDGDFESRASLLQWMNAQLPPSIRAVPVTQFKDEENYSWLHWKEAQSVDTLRRQNPKAMQAALADGKITRTQFDRAVAATPLTAYKTLFEDLTQSWQEYQALKHVLAKQFGPQAPNLIGVEAAIEDCYALVEGIVKGRRQQLPAKNADDKIPPGLTLRHTLEGDNGWIGRIAWSPNGRMLAAPSSDKFIRLWDAESGALLHALQGHSDWVTCVAWSPDGETLVSGGKDRKIYFWDVSTGTAASLSRMLPRVLEGHANWMTSVAWSRDGRLLASASDDMTVKIWDTETGTLRRTLQDHTDWVTSLAWSPDGQTLASASGDGAIKCWNATTWASWQLSGTKEILNGSIEEPQLTLRAHAGRVTSIAWSPSGRLLASACYDHTVRIWDPRIGKEIYRLEGHVETVRCVAFSFDERLLASKSWDGTVRLWRCDTWEMVALLTETPSPNWAAGLAFHPSAPVLATLGHDDSVIRIWDLDFATLLDSVSATALSQSASQSARAATVHYTNAKVILVGDSGVGKTALALALTGQPFVPTESTHGRHVWMFDRREAALNDGRAETRETLLWDLAGQPGYRLVHQLHLNEIAVALVIFDARSEIDPFSGVRYWDYALRQAQHVRGHVVPAMKKFLVAARTDRGGIGVSRARKDALVHEFGFEEVFETSAKEGWNITALAEAIRGAIDWKGLPKVSSTEVFHGIKTFLVEEKQAGHVLSTTHDLHRAFLQSGRALVEQGDLRAEVDTCIGLMESLGLIRRLSFGNLVLLQPELLDAYASAIVNAAKEEPDGMGSILEEDARTGHFYIPKDERLTDKAQETLLFIATIEDLLRYEIALREQADEGPYLVFPSQFTRERPDLPDPEGKAVLFRFEGPLLHVYATLAVRLAHSGLFTKQEMWKNAATYTARVGGTCGLFLQEIEEGHGALTLFFDPGTSEETRFQFEEYIRMHLQRRALPESMQRQRIFVCPTPGCGESITPRQATRRRALGYTATTCPVCGAEISLLDREERLVALRPSLVLEMDHTANALRTRAMAASILQGKMATSDFDVFLCHNSVDKPAVKNIGTRLKNQGILPWLDEWELRPGVPWQRLLEQQIGRIKAAAVFVGCEGIGPWQHQEVDAFLREFVSRDCPVIPIILPEASQEPQLPIFLKGLTWVDFRKQDPDPMERLIWGITGTREGA